MSRPRPARRRAVLLVEDDSGVRRVIRDMLRRCGCTVREAADGQEALDSLARERPDVVLLDAVLPGLHGLHVLERLSASGLPTPVPVIATTGSILSDEDLRERGARAVLRKPFTAHELRRVLDRVAPAGLPRRGRDGAGPHRRPPISPSTVSQ